MDSASSNILLHAPIKTEDLDEGMQTCFYILGLGGFMTDIQEQLFSSRMRPQNLLSLSSLFIAMQTDENISHHKVKKAYLRRDVTVQSQVILEFSSICDFWHHSALEV